MKKANRSSACVGSHDSVETAEPARSHSVKCILARCKSNPRYTCPMGVPELFFSLPTREVMQAIWAVRGTFQAEVRAAVHSD